MYVNEQECGEAKYSITVKSRPQYQLKRLFCCTGDKSSYRKYNQARRKKHMNDSFSRETRVGICLTYWTMMETFWSK